MHGFLVLRPWVWPARSLAIQVSLDIHESLQIAAYTLRQAWRWFQWSRFCKSNRHETFKFDELLPKRSHSCNFDMAGVAVGAMFSPAQVNDLIDMDRSEGDPPTNKCMWGCGELGSQLCALRCPLRPLDLRQASENANLKIKPGKKSMKCQQI